MIPSYVGRALNIPYIRIVNVPVGNFISFPKLKTAEMVHTGRRCLLLPTILATFTGLDDFAYVLLVIVRVVIFVQAKTKRVVFLIGIVVFGLFLQELFFANIVDLLLFSQLLLVMFVLQLDLIERILYGFYREFSIVVQIIRTGLILTSFEKIFNSTPATRMMAWTCNLDAVYIGYLVIRNLQIFLFAPIDTKVAQVVDENILFNGQAVLIDCVINSVDGFIQVTSWRLLSGYDSSVITLELLDIFIRRQTKVRYVEMKHTQMQQKNSYDKGKNTLYKYDTQEDLIIKGCIIKEVVEIETATVAIMIDVDPLAAMCPRVQVQIGGIEEIQEQL